MQQPSGLLLGELRRHMSTHIQVEEIIETVAPTRQATAAPGGSRGGSRMVVDTTSGGAMAMRMVAKEIAEAVVHNVAPPSPEVTHRESPRTMRLKAAELERKQAQPDDAYIEAAFDHAETSEKVEMILEAAARAEAKMKRAQPSDSPRTAHLKEHSAAGSSSGLTSPGRASHRPPRDMAPIRLKSAKSRGEVKSAKSRFVASTRLGGGGETCSVCGKQAYVAERVSVGSQVKGRAPLFFHTSCFCCAYCGKRLQGDTYGRTVNAADEICLHCPDHKVDVQAMRPIAAPPPEPSSGTLGTSGLSAAEGCTGPSASVDDAMVPEELTEEEMVERAAAKQAAREAAAKAAIRMDAVAKSTAAKEAAAKEAAATAAWAAKEEVAVAKAAVTEAARREAVAMAAVAAEAAKQAAATAAKHAGEAEAALAAEEALARAAAAKAVAAQAAEKPAEMDLASFAEMFTFSKEAALKDATTFEAVAQRAATKAAAARDAAAVVAGAAAERVVETQTIAQAAMAKEEVAAAEEAVVAEAAVKAALVRDSAATAAAAAKELATAAAAVAEEAAKAAGPGISRTKLPTARDVGGATARESMANDFMRAVAARQAAAQAAEDARRAAAATAIQSVVRGRTSRVQTRRAAKVAKDAAIWGAAARYRA